MKFDELDARMRVFETSLDVCVLPGIFMVARLDGRSFTRLTRDLQHFKAPYDERFRDLMLETTEHLMACGFGIQYGYMQSDEISLLFSQEDKSFGRKLRKLDSILAGEASGRFSLSLGAVASFDCRISQLPTIRDVVDYFRWRSEDAHRNALNGHCYWCLRQDGNSVAEATVRLDGMGVPQKNELLFSHGINFNDLPTWQKRGVGVYWQAYEKEAENPVTHQKVTASRRRLHRDMELPMKDEYSRFIEELVATHHS